MNNLKTIKIIFIVFFLAACAAKPKAPIISKPILPKTEESCIARGGEWIFAGPQNVAKYCFLQASDAGKKCKTSNDCQSECVERKNGNFCADTFSDCFAPTGHGTVTQCVY